MAYDELLAERIGRIFREKGIVAVEKKMMGGLCYMVDGKMCVGIVKDELMARVGTEVYEACLERSGCKEMNFTGRPMKGYVFIEPQAIDLDEELEYYVQLAIDFNPLAKSSKKKSRK